MIVFIGNIELEHRELRVVPCGYPLVPEVLVKFVHAFISADEKPLEIQFRSNAEIEVNAERVMMCSKRFGSCPAGDLVHHRGFCLDKPF